MKYQRFHQRFIPNMNVVKDWDIGSIELNLSPCATRQVNFNAPVYVATGEVVYIATPWLSEEKTSILLMDESYFSRHNVNPYQDPYVLVYPTRDKDSPPYSAIIKRTHLRLVSARYGGKVTINLRHPIYGTLVFNNVLADLNTIVEEDILLIPDSLWTLFMFNSVWVQN
jgi:hypothetical protein